MSNKKYVFSVNQTDSPWSNDENDKITIVTISTRIYWEESGCCQDNYRTKDRHEINDAFDDLELSELMESTYETRKPPEIIKSELNAHPLFGFDQSFDNFIKSQGI